MSMLREYLKTGPRPTAHNSQTIAGSRRTDTDEVAVTRSPWDLLCPAGTIFGSTGDGWRRLREMPAGTCVALFDDRPGSRTRLRRLARRAELTVERELILLPSAHQPLAVVDDIPDAVRHFWRSVATVPPGLAITALPAAAVLSGVRRMPWSWTGAIVPGRVLIGRRR